MFSLKTILFGATVALAGFASAAPLIGARVYADLGATADDVDEVHGDIGTSKLSGSDSFRVDHSLFSFCGSPSRFG